IGMKILLIDQRVPILLMGFVKFLLMFDDDLVLYPVKFHVMVLPILEYTKGMAILYGSVGC
ncbi:MAG: hypothetical protein EBS95_10205, partial [Chitinophagia bacterium]|nr:hypothetical protein [Chitinophagia bacterium]